MQLTMTLLAKARQEFLHTFDGVASLMLCPTLLDLVVLEISERLNHKLGTRTSGTRQRAMVDGRKEKSPQVIALMCDARLCQCNDVLQC